MGMYGSPALTGLRSAVRSLAGAGATSEPTASSPSGPSADVCETASVDSLDSARATGGSDPTPAESACSPTLSATWRCSCPSPTGLAARDSACWPAVTWDRSGAVALACWSPPGDDCAVDDDCAGRGLDCGPAACAGCGCSGSGRCGVPGAVVCGVPGAVVGGVPDADVCPGPGAAVCPCPGAVVCAVPDVLGSPDRGVPAWPVPGAFAESAPGVVVDPAPAGVPGAVPIGGAGVTPCWSLPGYDAAGPPVATEGCVSCEYPGGAAGAVAGDAIPAG